MGPAPAPGGRQTGRYDAMRYDAMRTALRGQEHDERMHRDSLFRIAVDVLGIAPDRVEAFARTHNDFVAEALFDRFHEQLRHLLRPGRLMQDVYVALLNYRVISEDCVAVVTTSCAKAGNSLYDSLGLPGMKLGQTNVGRDEGRHVRIAVIATRKFLAEYPEAEERLMEVVRQYGDMADGLLGWGQELARPHRRAPAASHGPDVDGLYHFEATGA
jgi:hypothetical protein